MMEIQKLFEKTEWEKENVPAGQMDFFNDIEHYNPESGPTERDKLIPMDKLIPPDMRRKPKLNKKTGQYRISPVDTNGKTFYTVDFTTTCRKHRFGRPCPYCFVDDARQLRCNYKRMFPFTEYQNDMENLAKKHIPILNRIGGIRLFSFADYTGTNWQGPSAYKLEDIEEDMDTQIEQFLNDCLKYGVICKAITKNPSFIKNWHDHPAISVINISIDNMQKRVNGEIVTFGVDWGLARSLRDEYPKVKIRSVAMNNADINDLIDISDVITLQHATGLHAMRDYEKDEEGNLKYDEKGKPVVARKYDLEDEIEELDPRYKGEISFKNLTGESTIHEKKTIQLYTKKKKDLVAKLQRDIQLHSDDPEYVRERLKEVNDAFNKKGLDKVSDENLVKLSSKVCCEGGKCVTCKVLCGISKPEIDEAVARVEQYKTKYEQSGKPCDWQYDQIQAYNAEQLEIPGLEDVKELLGNESL